MKIFLVIMQMSSFSVSASERLPGIIVGPLEFKQCQDIATQISHSPGPYYAICAHQSLKEINYE